MKLFYPILSISDTIVKTNFVQSFLKVFRETEDIHRVLVVIPLALFVSHSIFLKNQPGVSVMFYDLGRPEQIWVGLLGFVVFFVGSWAVFSSPFNPVLYIRQAVFIMWACLLHRLSYGLEVFGTPYLTTISVIALFSFIPFAFTGKRPDQLYEEYKIRKASELQAHPAVITTKEAA